MDGPQPLARLLEEWFTARGWLARLVREKALLVWPECVGPEIAAHARPLGWAGDALVVEVDHALWAQELSFLRKTIAERLNARLGGSVVADLRLRVRAGARPAPARSAPGDAAGSRGGDGGAPARRGGRRTDPAAATPRGPAAAAGAEVPLPAAVAAALPEVRDAELRERLSRCVRAAAEATGARCPACGAPLGESEAGHARGRRAGAPLCPVCRIERGPGSLRDLLSRWLQEQPWRDAADAERLLPGAGARLYPEVREELRSRWWQRLHRLASQRRGSRQGARELALRYVMLVTGLPPDQVTRERALAVLGPVAGQLLVGDG